MILVGKAWDDMRPGCSCCLAAIGAIRKTMSKEFHPANLCARCKTCDSTWVWQKRIEEKGICLAVHADGSKTTDGQVVRDGKVM